jgi:hypothetical protein
MRQRGSLLTGICVLLSQCLGVPPTAGAVSYLPPPGGWRYTYEGTFNSGVMDGPAGTGDDRFVGDFGPAGFGNHERVQALDGRWTHDQGSTWDGTAPGDPLSNPSVPSNPLGSLTGRQGTSPGGAGAFTDGNVNYIRIQDAGNPEIHGWVQNNLDDPAGPDDPINTNRRVYFGHALDDDGAVSDELVLSNTGVTLSFRVRIPNSGPLDNIYSALDTDGTPGPDVIPWLQDAPHGRGAIMTNGRGIINVAQNNPTDNNDTMVGFALVTSNDVAELKESGSTGSLAAGNDSGGLIMNNLVGDAPSNSIDSESPGTLNKLDIPDTDLNQWNEFWITMANNQSLPGNIEVKVYRNGSTTPSTFQVTLAGAGNAVYKDEDAPYLEFGISANALFGSFDMDFISYQLGVFAPVAAPVEDADFDNNNIVDGADFLAWQRGFGLTSGATNAQGDANGDGAVNDVDFNAWKAKFGGPPVVAAAGGVPEPGGAALALAAAMVVMGRRRRGV